MMLPALSLIETKSSATCLGDNQVSHNQIFEMNTMMIYVIGVGLKMIPVSAWHDADDPWWGGYDGQSILMMMMNMVTESQLYLMKLMRCSIISLMPWVDSERG